MRVKLISCTPNMLDVIYTGARTCYNAGSPVDMHEDIKNISEDKKLKLVKSCIESGHHSVLEHSFFTFAIEGMSKASSVQLLRHRHASFCLAGDTVIKQRSHGESHTIKELYESAPQYNKSRRIRCVNEDTHELQYDPIKEIIYSGKKPVYEITTNFGYKIKSTMQHRFFTQDGWKRLEELSVGDDVYVNGIVAYKDKEWLNNQYKILNKSQKEIGEMCGVSKHTIRKWISKYNLQKEMGSWCIGKEPVNKGRTKNDYEPMLRTSKKMMGNTNNPALRGENNPMWRGDNVGVSGGYIRTHKLNKTTGVCSNCGAGGYTELHHIDKNPTNTNSSNIMELCKYCHKAIHKKEIKEVIIPNTIISIEYVGIVDTYDISMAGDNHNFIANGFVVHNSQQSQRYCTFQEDKLNYVVPVKIKNNTEALNIFQNTMNVISKAYSDLLELGIPAEDSRAVLPNACETNLVVTLNLREFMHICSLRLCSKSQLEIRQVVKEMKNKVVECLPWLEEYLQPKCVRANRCDEKNPCGYYLGV